MKIRFVIVYLKLRSVLSTILLYYANQTMLLHLTLVNTFDKYVEAFSMHCLVTKDINDKFKAVYKVYLLQCMSNKMHNLEALCRAYSCLSCQIFCTAGGGNVCKHVYNKEI